MNSEFILLNILSILCLLVSHVSPSPHDVFAKHQDCKEKCESEDKKAAEEFRYDCGIHGKAILPCIRECLSVAKAEDPETCWCNLCKKKKGRHFCGDDNMFITKDECGALVCQPTMKVKYKPHVCKDPVSNPTEADDSDDDD